MNKILIVGLASIGLFLNACGPAYIAVQPTNEESARPARTNELDIWIEGDWVWSRQNHNYHRNAGYWHKPYQNRTYIQGQWQSSPRGNYWERGHWQRDNKGGSHRRR